METSSSATPQKPDLSLLKSSTLKDYFPSVEEIPIDPPKSEQTEPKKATKLVPEFYESDGDFKVFETDSTFN